MHSPFLPSAGFSTLASTNPLRKLTFNAVFTNSILEFIISFFEVIAFVVLQNRSNFFSGIPPFQYLLQITLTDSTSNSSPTHSLQKPLFLSPLHLYIITDNHLHPFCPYSYHVRVTQLPSFRSTNNLYIFVNHKITHSAYSSPMLQNTLFSSIPLS